MATDKTTQNRARRSRTSRLAIAYVIALVAFTVFVLLDTFVIGRAQASANAMDTAIEHIEVMTSYGNAELYFYSQLNWDRDNEVVKDFMAIVRNHFQK
jgi:hypothetical protein